MRLAAVLHGAGSPSMPEQARPPSPTARASGLRLPHDIGPEARFERWTLRLLVCGVE